jgi:hypothetical protein
MHVRGRKIRHLASILGSVGVAAVLATTLTSASATASRAAATTTAFALRGSTAGGVKTIQTDQTLTFVFTETNRTTASVPEDLVTTHLSNITVTGAICVVPGGVAINTDSPASPACEPGFVKPGQRASLVLTTTVTGSVSGTAASARVCLLNENTGATGPCKTVFAKIA